MPVNPLQTDIMYLKGVGPQRAKTLGEDLHVLTLRDMLYQIPYKYIDRSVVHRVCDLVEGMPYVLLRGTIRTKDIEGAGRKERLVANFTDGTGYVQLVWFNRIRGVEKSLRYDVEYTLLGKPSAFGNHISIVHPDLEERKAGADDGTPMTMLPHYHTSERMKRQGFTSRLVGELVDRAFEAVGDWIKEETLPAWVAAKHKLLPIDKALRTAHHPASSADLPAALHRLKFEELFYLQLEILRYSQNRKLKYAGYPFARVGDFFLDFYNNHLPFSLTDAQKRVVREIRRDMGCGRQMNRLLQGDVGSGKTMVALLCCLLALDNGFQACIMAPTEILAEQHLESLRGYLRDMPVRVELLTGRVKGKARKEVLRGVADGSVQILVGTHALTEPTVCFLNLGLAVIDEQHRFGVKQRASLWAKNARPPHVLVMTATPIPRTLAMTVYGDLDVSVIDQLPPGRKPIYTVHCRQAGRAAMYDGIRKELQKGRQVYVVYPLIKENEKQNLHDLETGYALLTDTFPEYKVGMVHGQMRPDVKEAEMSAFKNGDTRMLVSTTVIEVGVNVPNASVMVIENAENFGLAQLHQLRGRVGRGAEQSYCVLMTKDKLSDTSLRRMKIMTDTTDGFVIAEEDMKLRGPGDLEGTAQSGMPFDLKVANVIKDRDLMAQARETAAELLRDDPQGKLPQNEVAWAQLARLHKRQTNFSAIS